MSENQNLSVVKHESVPLGAIVVATENRLEAIERVGEWINRSGMFGTTSPEQGAVIALRCMEEGLTLAEYDRTYDLVRGKSRKKALAALAEFEAKGGEFEWLDDGSDRQKASIRLKYKGRTLTSTYTIEDAELAGLVKHDSGWQKNPPNMLRARAISNGLGMIAPGLFAGVLDEDPEPGPELKLAGDAPVPPASSAKSKPAPKAEPKPATTVTVEAEVVPPTAKAEPPPAPKANPSASAGIPKPNPTTVPAPAPAPVSAPAPTPAAATPLPDALQEELIAAIGGAENIPMATAYCRSIQWLPEDGTLDELTEGNARGIIKKAARFLAKAQEFAAMQKGGAK